ncbi:hypothetical protein HK103_003094 [Boothiomyces macroporosus]|uniref:Uncharacterized protein n=1 Tax=Boothiomyces macroporosus TaxID=261099 RepID=A0AAD5UIB3_9FUNG|nr:hypothetical protein HK103_003094 [Boothiomyces macroporosus]
MISRNSRPNSTERPKSGASRCSKNSNSTIGSRPHTAKGRFKVDFQLDTGMELQVEKDLTRTNTSYSSLFTDTSDKEMHYTITDSEGATIELTAKESLYLSNSLRVRHQAQQKKLKGLIHAGIAPTRFNLNRVSVGKYVTRLAIHHKWKSQRAKLNWQKLRATVVSAAAHEIHEFSGEQDDEEDGAVPYQQCLMQGLKCQQILRRPQQITTLCHHLKIPTHFQDGSFGHENEVEYERRDFKELLDDEEEDLFADKAAPSRNKSYSIATLDTNRYMTIWDINNPEPKLSIKMHDNFSNITFLSRYFLYAGLSNQKTVKFFTSKLEITSLLRTSHLIISIHYDPVSNLLIAVGTDIVTVWDLEATVTRGALCIQPTLRYSFVPIPENPSKWIDMIHFEGKQGQLYVVIKTDIYIYSLHTGELLHHLKNVHSRKITSISYHEEYQYLLVGSVDGTIKAAVHTFVAHAKQVVAITVFPNSPLVASCGLDHTIRLYNLKYFKEINSLHLKDLPIDMQRIDDVTLYIRTRTTIEIWVTNQFNVNFTSMSSNISRLIYVPQMDNKFSRIIARTADGVNRILSPVNGRTITANLPLLETDTVRDVAYYSLVDRLFVLLEGGEIWVFRTDQNPCTIVDVWDSSETSILELKLGIENCLFLIVCYGTFSTADQAICPNSLKDFGILLGGTKNGHVLVFGHGGKIIDRYQLHFGGFTQMEYDPINHSLITGGLDEHIRISTIKPLDPNLIQIRIDIQINFIPRILCNMGNIICTTSDDATIHMFEYNLKRQEWRILTGHAKSYDHTQIVTSICCSHALGVFMSISNDNSLRIWNHQNKMLREIHFQEPINGLCLANERADLLIGMENRIDVVKSSAYLPPAYLNSRPELSKDKGEATLAFDDSLIPFTRGHKKSANEREKTTFDKTNPLEVFIEINLKWFEKVSNTRRKGVFQSTQTLNISAEPAEDELEVFLLNIESTVREKLHKRHTEEMERQMKIQNELNAKLVQSSEKEAVLPLQELQEMLLIKKVVKEPEDEEDSDDEFKDIKPNMKLNIAPDGIVPNSKVGKEVHKWLKDHGKLDQSQFAIHAFRKKKPKEKKKKVEDKTNKSNEYKNRLKELMQKMVEEEEIEEEAKKEEVEEEVVKEEVEITKLRLGTPNQLKHVELAPIEKEIKEVFIPETIERLMNYEWYPEDLKNSGSPDELFPILASIFNKIPTSKRSEYMQFIKWMASEYGYQNTGGIFEFFCSILAVPKVSDSEDMRCRVQIIELLVQLNCEDVNFFIALLPHVLSLYDSLKSVGITCIELPFIQQKLEAIYEESKQVEMNNQVFGTESGENPLRTLILEFLQDNLKRYLMNSVSDPQIATQIQKLSIFGGEPKTLGDEKKRKKKKKQELATLTIEYDPSIPYTLPERNYLKEDASNFQIKAMQVQSAVFEMRTKDYGTQLDLKHYPQLNLPLIGLHSNGDPITILKNPTIVDYVNGINYILYEEELRIKEEKRLREEKEAARKVREEADAKAARERAEEIEKRARLAAERQALEDERKERLRLLKEAKEAALAKSQIPARRLKFSEMSTRGIGKTHQSCCHHSREVLDVTLRHLPEYTGQPKYVGFINSSLSIHLKTINKSMPLEQVRLEPFEEPRSMVVIKQQKNYKRKQRNIHTSTSAQDSSYELDYIRGTIDNHRPQSTPTGKSILKTPQEIRFQPGRKYFIPGLSIVNEGK